MEARQLLSLGAEMPGAVNTQTFLGQYSPDNATNAGGESVVVWETQSGNNGLDIHAQRYNSFGTKVGSEIVVFSSVFNEVSPAVAIDDLGDFAVTWIEVENSNANILETREFDFNGNPMTARIDVTGGVVYDPDIAMDQTGNFVVTYSDQLLSGDTNVYAARYASGGKLLGNMAVSATSLYETHARIAMTPDGRFDVTYELGDSNDHDIYLRRFAANGTLLGSEPITLSPDYDETPAISVDNSSNGVVVWEEDGAIESQRFTSTGALGVWRIVSGHGIEGENPAVAIRRDGGGYVVSYFAVLSGGSSTYQVSEVSAANTVQTFNAGRGAGSLSIDAFGNYFMTYAAPDAGGDYNIHARRGSLLS
jgi:hypothetical protein